LSGFMPYIHEKRIILVIRGKVTPKKRTLHGYDDAFISSLWGLPRRAEGGEGGRKFGV
jgi:hypothetical protein